MQRPSAAIPRGHLRYLQGDVTVPVGGGLRFILQVNNDEGKYGAGVSGAISKKWPRVQEQYRMWWRDRRGVLPLGEIQEVLVQPDVRVINMIAQKGIGIDKDGKPPIRYDALEACLDKVGVLVSQERGTIHMPRIGCGLAGGTWDKVEPLIIEQLSKRGLNVTVYDLIKNT
jgi:O-acetyl-ADP-ribose deacetylase (regulator of RNase III)